MPFPGTQAASVGSAAADLGFGSALAQQVAGETDEERKRRLAREAQMKALGPAASPAVMSLFGGGQGLGGSGAALGKGY